MSPVKQVSATFIGSGIVFIFFAICGYLWWMTETIIKIDLPTRGALGIFGFILLILGIHGSGIINIRKLGNHRKRILVIVTILLGFVIVFSGSILFLTSPPPSPPQKTPLTAAWKAQGPGAIDVRYENGRLVLAADLKGSDDYAELFVDLTKVDLPNLEQNTDGTYNFVGKKLNATVRSASDFRGDLNYTNGVQFLVKNKQFSTNEGLWFDATPAMTSPEGMNIFYKIPDNSISREVAGLSVKFTVGHGSNASYNGELFLDNVMINSEAGNTWIYSLAFIASVSVAVVVAVVILWFTKPR